MDSTVFDVFQLTPYEFLQVSRGGVAGNMILATSSHDGVFKLRSGLVTGDNAEEKTSDASLHVMPTEAFISANNGNLVGHGIRHRGQDYEITSMTGGDNFHTGVREHYTLQLQETDYSDFEVAA